MYGPGEDRGVDIIPLVFEVIQPAKSFGDEPESVDDPGCWHLTLTRVKWNQRVANAEGGRLRGEGTLGGEFRALSVEIQGGALRSAGGHGRGV